MVKHWMPDGRGWDSNPRVLMFCIFEVIVNCTKLTYVSAGFFVSKLRSFNVYVVANLKRRSTNWLERFRTEAPSSAVLLAVHAKCHVWSYKNSAFIQICYCPLDSIIDRWGLDRWPWFQIVLLRCRKRLTGKKGTAMNDEEMDKKNKWKHCFWLENALI